MLPRSDPDGCEGYASLTAMVLCSAVAILCASTLALVTAERRTEARRLARLQLDEVVNTAVLRFVPDVLASTNPFEIKDEKTVNIRSGQAFKVELTAQSEFSKWPIARLAEVDSGALTHAIHLPAERIATLVAESGPALRNDCVRSLFSDLGQADPAHDRPGLNSALYASSAKDGQVWRIRAVSNGRVEERRVRFLGTPDRPFATVSVEHLSLGEMPTCTDLIARS